MTLTDEIWDKYGERLKTEICRASKISSWFNAWEVLMCITSFDIYFFISSIIFIRILTKSDVTWSLLIELGTHKSKHAWLSQKSLISSSFPFWDTSGPSNKIRSAKLILPCERSLWIRRSVQYHPPDANTRWSPKNQARAIYIYYLFQLNSLLIIILLKI